MDTYFATWFVVTEIAEKLVDAADVDRTVTLTGDQISVGYDDTVWDTSGLLLMNAVPYVLALPAGHELWARSGEVNGAVLRVWVGAR